MTSPKSHVPSTFAIVLFAGLCAAAFGIGNATLQGGWSLEGAAAATRITARVSFVWFVAAWSASALAQFWPGGWRTALLRRRRAVGLGFAAAHGVHLVALSTAIGYFGHESSSLAILGGGLCYIVIFAMAATSNSWGMQTLGQMTWKRLHVVGGYFAALVFTNSYVGRLESQPVLAICALTLLAIAFGLQFAKIWKNRKPSSREAGRA
jgi:methionine sulfoxide reductase heme-binding subunit